MGFVRLNDKAFKAAAKKIEDGKIVKASVRSGSTEIPRTSFSGMKEPYDNENGCLGVVTGECRATPGAWEYPLIDADNISRPALILARAQAVSRGHTAIAEAAGQLLALIDGGEASKGIENVGLLGFVSSAAQLEAVDWEDMDEGAIQLFPFGHINGIDGRQYDVTDVSMETVPSLFANRSNPMVIDYEHNTYSCEPFASLAAGWIWQVMAAKPAFAEDDLADGATVSAESLSAIEAEMGTEAAKRIAESGPGIYALVRWTRKAGDHVRAREYLFLSPVFRHTEQGEVLELYSAGLTNDPNFEGMMPAAAKQGNPDGLTDSAKGTTVGNAESDRESAENSATDTGGNDMDWKTLAAQMGIKATSEEDFIAQAAALKVSAEAGATASARVQELEADKVKTAAESDVAQAIEDRKLLPEQREAFVAMATEDRGRFDTILAVMKPMEKPVDEPDKPPQGRETSKASADDGKGGLLSFSIAGNEGHFIDPERLATANAVLAQASARQGGNTAKAIRILGHSAVTQ